MNTETKTKTCVFCTKPPTDGIFCNRCDAIELSWSAIRDTFLETELGDFAASIDGSEPLRVVRHGQSDSGLIPEAKSRGAYIRTGLLTQIRSICMGHGIEELTIRKSLVAKIEKHIGYMQGANEYDEKHGEGAYEKYCAHVLSKIIKEAFAETKK